MGCDARKPVFWVSDKVRFKPNCLATEGSKKIEISLIASLYIIFSNKRITKALIILHKCAGWSALCCTQTPEDKFSRVEAHITVDLEPWVKVQNFQNPELLKFKS